MPANRHRRRQIGTPVAIFGNRSAGHGKGSCSHEESSLKDLAPEVFKQSSPHRIAVSLKPSAQQKHRRKSEPFRSAMSMLNFYINRTGRTLGKKQVAVLERAKTELRQVFHKTAGQ